VAGHLNIDRAKGVSRSSVRSAGRLSPRVVRLFSRIEKR
jgi:hypothetical protein